MGRGSGLLPKRSARIVPYESAIIGRVIRSHTDRSASLAWVAARLAVRVVLGALLLFVVLMPLLAQEGEPSTGATVYGYVAMALVLLAVGTSIYRLLRRSGIGKRRAGIVGVVAAPATYVTCALAYVLIARIA